MKRVKELISKAASKTGPHSKQHLYQKTIDRSASNIQRHHHDAAMADQEEDYSSLPLTDRFTHKVHSFFESRIVLRGYIG